MSTVAQPYPPERPIAVGNRQPHVAARHIATPLPSAPRNSTFPSLVGSFGSRLVVGNRQQRPSPTGSASLRITRQHISTNTKPSSDRIRAVFGGLVLLRRSAPSRTASHRTVTPHISTQLTIIRGENNGI